MNSPRILLYVQHLLGVGHVKRAAAITRAMLAEGLEVLVVLGGEQVPFADFGAARVEQLAPVRALDMTFKTLVGADGRPADAALWELRRARLLEIAEAFAPDLLLVEHFPFGRRKFAGELTPLFERLKAQQRPILCSVRDVLVEKEDAARTDRVIDLVTTWFDRVLVHGDPAVIAFTRTFPAAERIKDRIVHTGYVVEEAATGSDGTDEPSAGEVIVSTGGGAVGASLMQAAVEAALAGALAPRRWRLLAGANLPEPVFQRLCARSSERLIVERARPDFRALLARCALSISQAGYNTLMDILSARCAALVVPFAGAAESEQLLRARELERRGLLMVLEEAALTPAALAGAAEAAMRRGAGRLPGIDLDGARATARIVRVAAENSAQGSS